MNTYHLAPMLLVTALVVGVFAGPILAEAQGVLEPREEQDERDDEDRDEDEDGEDEERTNEGVEEMVRDVFEDDPLMVRIAACESSFRQYASDGDVLTNPSNNSVVGVFQLHEDYHEEPADDLGFDIYETEGNILYAQHLYETEGIAPWGPSSLCWDEDNLDIEGRDGPITLKLVIGTDHDQVRQLQEILNENNHELSENSPGSPGNETTYFGNKTKAAIQDLQCEYNIVCEGSEYTTGFGLVDEETREVINELANNPTLAGVRIRTEEDRRSQTSAETDESSENKSASLDNMSRSQMQELLESLQEQVRLLTIQIQ